MSQRQHGDDSSTAEAVDQLHHLDDRRDAAEMRIEDLVRDTEFESRSHGQDSHASRLLFVILAAVIAAGGLAYLWLRSACL